MHILYRYTLLGFPRNNSLQQSSSVIYLMGDMDASTSQIKTELNVSNCNDNQTMEISQHPNVQGLLVRPMPPPVKKKCYLWNKSDMKAALELLRRNPFLSVSRVASQYNVPRTTLRRIMVREGLDNNYKRPVGRPRLTGKYYCDLKEEADETELDYNIMDAITPEVQINEVWVKDEFEMPNEEERNHFEYSQDSQSNNIYNYNDVNRDMTFIQNGISITIPKQNIIPLVFMATDTNGNKHVIVREKNSKHLLAKYKQTVQVNCGQVQILDNVKFKSLPSCDLQMDSCASNSTSNSIHKEIKHNYVGNLCVSSNSNKNVQMWRSQANQSNSRNNHVDLKKIVLPKRSFSTPKSDELSEISITPIIPQNMQMAHSQSYSEDVTNCMPNNSTELPAIDSSYSQEAPLIDSEDITFSNLDHLDTTHFLSTSDPLTSGT